MTLRDPRTFRIAGTDERNVGEGEKPWKSLAFGEFRVG